MRSKGRILGFPYFLRAFGGREALCFELQKRLMLYLTTLYNLGNLFDYVFIYIWVALFFRILSLKSLWYQMSWTFYQIIVAPFCLYVFYVFAAKWAIVHFFLSCIHMFIWYFKCFSHLFLSLGSLQKKGLGLPRIIASVEELHRTQHLPIVMFLLIWKAVAALR